MKYIAIIYWKDACKYGSNTTRIDDCKNLKLMKLVSCGIIIEETKKTITLCNDYCAKFDNCRDVSVFPKSEIYKIKRIPIKNPK